MANRLKPHPKTLIENLFKHKAIVTDGITYYLYCEGVGCWSQMYSGTATGELLQITGSTLWSATGRRSSESTRC